MTAPAPQSDLLYPLSHFFRLSGQVLPPCELIKSSEMPEPYRALLVHHGDMTSRLEKFHGAPMQLRVLHSEGAGDTYRREVLLCAQDTGLPVEYGAIAIDLTQFAEPLRSLILAGRQPLGGLLNHHAVRYRSEPRAFLKLAPDSAMDAHFELDGAHTLYGRCNVLLGERDQILARIVEVLRP
jgi:chorismate-pyruvate lyase